MNIHECTQDKSLIVGHLSRDQTVPVEGLGSISTTAVAQVYLYSRLSLDHESPCATGGTEAVTTLVALDKAKHLFSYAANGTVSALCFLL
ncbi:hypothetical protein SeMB42_g06178 [Synchytrium endobioticum]|uniref:Uncharacterized protein n=1 Tax=Synchytrium endobioticum TaxID=286115 RepID=A0A507CM63_9FUNG|nr:hypothetical protein SeMB42_g06178 [Synchytrium endobioticum]